MTYAGFETSQEGSRPIELYRFELGTTTYLWTSAEDAITFNLETYQPETISRSKIGQSHEASDGEVVVTVPATNPLARLYISVVPGQRAKCTITRLQRSDFPSPGSLKIFQGMVRSVGFSEQGKLAKVLVVPLAAAASRPCPRFGFQAGCNNVLGDGNCQVDLNLPAFRFDGTISAASGNTVTVPGASAFGDGWFTAGFVEALSGLDARAVLEHVGDDLRLMLPFPFSPVGQPVTLFAGCSHDIDDPQGCGPKFNNVLNFGGFAFVPTKNPFQTGL